MSSEIEQVRALKEADDIRVAIHAQFDPKTGWPKTVEEVLKYKEGAVVYGDELDVGSIVESFVECLHERESVTKSIMSVLLQSGKDKRSVMSVISAPYAILVSHHDKEANKLRIVGTSESLLKCFKAELENHMTTTLNEILKKGQVKRQGQGQGQRQGTRQGQRQGQGQGTRQGQGQGKTVTKQEAQEMALKGLQAGKKHKNWQQSQ